MCRIPDGMKWSFSKLEAFHHCGMMFKLIYLDHAEKEGNGFSDYGTFCHKLLEEWANLSFLWVLIFQNELIKRI